MNLSPDILPSQRLLSDQLNVSRPSLREAFLALETLGLVQALPARRTFVLDPGTSPPLRTVWRFNHTWALRENFQSRLLLESKICRLAAGTIADAALDQLAAANAAFEAAWHKGDLVAHGEADLPFHGIIATSCAHRMLTAIYQTTQELLAETHRQPIPNTADNRMARSIAEHHAILAALRRADGGVAERSVRKHVRNTARCAGVAT